MNLVRNGLTRGRLFALGSGGGSNLGRGLPHDAAGTARVGTRTTAATGTVVRRERTSGVLFRTSAGRWNGNLAVGIARNLLTGLGQVGITAGTGAGTALD